MQLADISMPTICSTVFIYSITCLGCIPTLSACATPVLVALLQTLPKASCPNLCTTSLSRCPFWSFSSMLIFGGSILALMVPRFTSLHAVAWPDSHPWNPSSMLTSKSLHQNSWKVQLCYGFYHHTVVLDKDSKFFGVCRKALNLLHIDCHVLSGNNHNPRIAACQLISNKRLEDHDQQVQLCPYCPWGHPSLSIHMELMPNSRHGHLT